MGATEEEESAWSDPQPTQLSHIHTVPTACTTAASRRPGRPRLPSRIAPGLNTRTRPSRRDGRAAQVRRKGRERGRGEVKRSATQPALGAWALGLSRVVCFLFPHTPRPTPSFSARLTDRILPLFHTLHAQARPQPHKLGPSKNALQLSPTRWLELVGSVFRSLGARAQPAALVKSAQALSGLSPHLAAGRAGPGVRGRRAASRCPMKRKLLSNAGRRRGSAWPSGRQPTLECERTYDAWRARGERRRGQCGDRHLVGECEDRLFLRRACKV